MKRPSFLLFACLFSLLLSAARCKTFNGDNSPRRIFYKNVLFSVYLK